MTETYDTCLILARAELLRARALLADEITQYPTPISGCDAQFNHLIAERSRIGDALTALNAAVFVPTPRSPSPDTGVESR